MIRWYTARRDCKRRGHDWTFMATPAFCRRCKRSSV